MKSTVLAVSPIENDALRYTVLTFMAVFIVVMLTYTIIKNRRRNEREKHGPRAPQVTSNDQ